MVINSKILNIPPYISTTWDQVASIYLEEKSGHPLLVVHLISGKSIEIPGLGKETLKQIFEIHAQVLQENPASSEKHLEGQINFGLPVKMGIEGFEQMSGFMQHNPKQADHPDLPPDMVQKIISVSKALGIHESGFEIPDAQPHCNCPYCQIARALNQKEGEESTGSSGHEEMISEEDLKFRDWEISQEADKIYNVTNPLDAAEHYQVYLGEPIGCTCGSKNCEHIRAVLNS